MSKCATQKSLFVLLLFWLLCSLILTACDNNPTNQVTDSNLGVPIIAPTPTQTVTLQTATSTNANSPIPKTTTASSQPFSNWYNRWLIGQPCRLPCWEGITLGQTSIDEALNIIKVFKGKEKGGGNYGSPYIYHYSFWTTPDSDYEQQFYYSTEGKIFTVYLVRLHVPDFTLKDVLKTYGQPSLIVATPVINPDDDGPKILGYEVTMVFEKLGLVLSTETKQKPILNENMLMNRVQFFALNHPDLTSIEVYPKRLALTWEGFKDFDYYCRELYYSKPINCT